MLTKYAFDVLTHGFGAQRRHTGWGVTRETSSMDTHDRLVHAHEIARGEWADEDGHEGGVLTSNRPVRTAKGSC